MFCHSPMQAEDSVKPPSSWSKYGEIFIDERLKIVFICSICRETVHNFAEIFTANDVTSLWDHIEQEHAERLQFHEINEVNIHKEVQSDNKPIKTEPSDECEDSDIYKELNNEPLAKVNNSNICTMDSTVITIEDSDDEVDQQECPRSPPQSEEAPQQSNNPQKEIFEKLGLALFEALKYNDASVTKSNQSAGIQNCYSMINNYNQQTPNAPSVQDESHQARNRPSDNQEASDNTPAEQNQRENIPPEQNNGRKHKQTTKTVKFKVSPSKKMDVLNQKRSVRQCTRIIQCNECRYRMTYEIGFLRHKVEYHTVQGNTKMKRCSTCLLLVWKKEFKEHKAQHSLQQTQNCVLCPVTFAEQNKLLTHYIEQHKILEDYIAKRRKSYEPPTA